MRSARESTSGEKRLSKTDQLRKLPSVDEVLRLDLFAVSQRHSRQQLTDWVRQGVQVCRSRIINGESLDEANVIAQIIEFVRQQQAADAGQAIQHVINATGVILHTNLGRAPLAPLAIDRMIQAARYANVELDLASGRRSRRGQRVMKLLAQLTGAEDAVVVNNCAAATMLVLQSIASAREVIVSRGQLVEIGGGFRLPDVFRAAGVILREVGTTNRTYLSDYEAAVGDDTGAIIRVHHSNFRQTGFVTEPTIDELVAAQRPSEIPIIDDLGSGCMEDLSVYGLSEPTVTHSVRAGADLILFSGDKLFGGPQCGIVIGHARWIDRIRQSPMMRAMRVDKMTLAALEATTEIHLRGDAISELPVLRMLSADAETIRRRCEQLIERIGGPSGAEIVACDSQVGGGSVPGRLIKSFGLKFANSDAETLAVSLRSGLPAVQGRVTADSLLLDLRTVHDHELEPLATRLRDALAGGQDASA